MPVRNNILPPRSGLVGEWLLDGSVNDSNDGTKNNGTFTGSAYANCDYGYQKQTGSFNGSTGRFSVSRSVAYESLSGSIAVAFSTSNKSNQGLIIEYGNTINTDRNGFVLFRDTSGFLNFEVANASTFYRATYSTDVSDGKNHLAICRWNGTTVYLDVDGVNVASAAQGGAITFSTDGLYIGGETVNGSRYFNGKIGTIRFFNYEISAFERKALWHEFNRKLGGGSDFGVYLPTPIFYHDGLDATDIAGQADVTNGGVTFGQTDRFGIAKAGLYNGSSNYLQASNAFLSGLTGVTFFAHFKTTYSAADTELMVSNNVNAVYTLRISGGNPYWRVYSGGSHTTLNPSGNVTDGIWHTVIGVWNGSTMEVFRDGISIGSTAKTGAAGALDSAFRIGSFPTGSSFFNGTGAEFGVLPSGIDANQAKHLHRLLVSGKYPYPFNQSYPLFLTSGMVFRSASFDGTNVRDCSGNGKSASVTQGTYSKSRLGQNVLRYQSSAATQNLSMGTDAAFKPTSAFSFATTVIPTSSSYAGSPRLFTNEGTAGAINVGLGRSSATDMLPWVRLNYAAGSVPATARALPLNKPTRYSVTYDGATVKIYLNGVLDSYASYSGSISYDAGVTSYLSRGINTNGIIGHQGSDILWNRALSYDEVRHDFYSTFA